MHIQEIALADIRAEDDTYRYHYWKYDREALQASLEAVGIRTPVILEPVDQGYRVVHGFRRLECAVALGMPEVPTIISEQTGLQNLEDSLRENRAVRPFNIYEQSRVMALAQSLGAKTSDVIGQFLPVLGLHPIKHLYDEYTGFHRLPAPLIEFLVDKDVPISRTQVFQQLDAKGLEITLQILDAFSPGINVLDELITNLYEIGRREQTSLGEVFRNLEIPAVIDQAAQPHQALGEVRRRIRERRYPVLHETNRTIGTLADQLDLGPRARIHWDNKLESRGVNGSFHWDATGDVQETITHLSDEKNMELLRKIFELV